LSSISILSYGVGNINSLVNMLKKCGAVVNIIESAEEVLNAGKIILPGVGSFDYAMSALKKLDLLDALNHAVLVDKTPILGICLGMQMMCKSSEEGCLNGLGWIDAKVKKIHSLTQSSLKIPHMGWNSIDLAKQNPLLSVEEGTRFYFVHSYGVHCNNSDDVLATCFYGETFDVAVGSKNIYGVQFHPEKSHRFGMEFLSNFVRLQSA